MKIELYRRLTLRGRRWFFRLRARNGEIVAVSEGYHNFKDAQETVGAIMLQAAFAKVEILK